MFRMFILSTLIFLGLSVSLFPLQAQLPIGSLNSDDKNYLNFHSLIEKNRKAWLKIEKNPRIRPSEIRNITPLSIAIYHVQDGDTVFSIAEKMGLNVDTLISFNSLANSLSISTGDVLLIPSMDGVLIYPSHKISTEKLARIYDLPESLLLYTNSLAGGQIYAKEEVFIPFGRMSDEEKNYFLFQPFSFPLNFGKFSSNYGMRFHPIRKHWLFHGGIDIATPSGSDVYASADGKVVYAGAALGYGNLVVIRHKYGYTSWYGHLSKILVSIGERVAAHTRIAFSGSTGISTGPHLHFEIRRFNLRENPMEILTFEHQATVYNDKDQNLSQEDNVASSTD